MAWAGAALVLAHVPWVVSALPPLGVLRGTLGWAVLGAACLTVVARRAELGARLAAAPPRLLFACSSALFAACGLHYTGGIQATGDEVEYLMLTQSLWREHDLDLADNFARGDHLEYTPELGAMPFGTFRRDGRPVSTHSPGLPSLLAPVYAFGGRAACVLVLALCASWLALETRALALRVTGDAHAAALAWLTCVGPPTFFYSFHVYTEVPTALLVVLALRWLLAPQDALRAAAAALAVGALAFLHVKLLAAAALLGLLGVLRLRGRARAAFLGVGLVAAGAFAWHSVRLFGDPTPLGLYGSRVPKKIKRADPTEALPGLLLDSSSGLLPNAPVFVVALAGLGAWRRLRAGDRPASIAGSATSEATPWERFGALSAVSLGALVPLIVWQTWWAGHCPPARFMVPLVPWLATLVALRVSDSPAGLARWTPALALTGLALAGFMSWQPGQHLMLNNASEPTHVWEALAGSPEPGVQPGLTTSLGRYLPRLASGERADARIALLWTAALALLLVLDRLARRYARVERWFHGPRLAALLLLGVAMAAEHWAR